MKRPVHPQHSLTEPKKVYTHSPSDLISHFYWEGVSLTTAINAWNKIVKDLSTQGYQVTKGPFIKDGYLHYTYERTNLKYDEEKAVWDAAMAEYHQKMADFLAYEAAKKTALPSLDEKIRRTEERLANLKAAKVGEPLPFPETNT